MNSLKKTLWFICALVFVSGFLSAAQQADEKPPFSEPPKLQLAFDDDFATDTRGDYKTKGDVKWEKGKLTLGKKTTLQRTLNDAGPWIEVEMDLEFPELTEDGQKSELKVWLDLQNAPDSFVRFRQERKDGKTQGSLQIVDTRGNWNSFFNRQIVMRKLNFSDGLSSGNWTVSFRNCSWRVLHKKKLLLAAHVEKGALQPLPIGIVIGEMSDSLAINKLRVVQTTLAKTEFAKSELAKLETAMSLDKRVVAMWRSGQFADAIPLAQESLELRLETLGEFHRDTAFSYFYLAVLYQELNNSAQAEKLQLAAKHIREKVLGKQHLDYSTSLNNLGILFKSIGAYEKAESIYVESKQIKELVVGKSDPEYVSALCNLAALYDAMGLTDKALPMYLEAKQIQQKKGFEKDRNYSTVLNNLGSIYHRTGAPAKAEQLLLDAKKIDEDTLGTDHPRYATTLNNLGALYESMGLYEKAEPLFLSAKQIRETALGKSHPDYATSLNNLAALHQAKQEYSKAELYFLEAKQIRAEILGKEHPDYANSLVNLASHYDSIGSHQKAATLLQESLEITLRNFRQHASILSEAQQIEYQNRFQDRLGFYLSNYQRSSVRNVADPADLLIAWKGQVQLRQSAYRAIATSEETAMLFEQHRTISQQIFKQLEKNLTPSVKDQVDRLTNAKESIEKLLASRSSRFTQTMEPVKLQHIQEALPSGTVFLNLHQYRNSKIVRDEWNFQDRLLAFVVHSTGKVKILDLGESDSILKAVADWRTIFDPEKDTVANQKKAEIAAALLRKRLWEPVEKHFHTNVKTVLISPDGELGTLPFPALPGKTKDSYLVGEYQIATIPVPSLLAEIAKQEPGELENPKALLVGDVDYSNSVKATEDATHMIASRWRGVREILQGDWPQLAQTGAEVDKIKAVLVSTKSIRESSIQILKQSQASEFLFRGTAPKFNILHIATHGFFADPKFETAATTERFKTEDRSLQFKQQLKQQYDSARYYKLHHPGILSGLVFAGVNKKEKDLGADDGIMTADEISVLQFKDVDLVTLSACETGLGKVAGGEGLIGIQRAFQISGARTTVASLWKVDDLATRKLMERFYRNMFEKRMGKLAALAEAQRWLLNNPQEHSDITRGKGKLVKNNSQIETAKSRTLHPRYWAAWVLSGDWR